MYWCLPLTADTLLLRLGPLHPLSELAGVGVRTLVEVRYLNANEAQARFGINANGGPVIVVSTSKQ